MISIAYDDDVDDDDDDDDEVMKIDDGISNYINCT